jgi:tetratricopeptide (TPR) repeat protein
MTAALGKDHPAIAMLWANRVEPLYFLDRSEEAMTTAKIAVEIYERAQIRDGADVAWAIEQLATMHIANGRYGDGLPLLQRARTMLEAALGPHHDRLAGLWQKLGTAYVDAREPIVAATSYRKAIEIWERTRGPQHVYLAQPLLSLAEIHIDGKDPNAALPLAERAVAIREGQAGDPHFLAYALFVHGRAVFAATRDKRRTCERISKALATYAIARTSFGKNLDADVAEVHAWLAEHELNCSRAIADND